MLSSSFHQLSMSKAFRGCASCISVSTIEQVWDYLREGVTSPSEGASQLCEARDTGTLLSSQSQDFIILEVSNGQGSFHFI